LRSAGRRPAGPSGGVEEPCGAGRRRGMPADMLGAHVHPHLCRPARARVRRRQAGMCVGLRGAGPWPCGGALPVPAPTGPDRRATHRGRVYNNAKDSNRRHSRRYGRVPMCGRPTGAVHDRAVQAARPRRQAFPTIWSDAPSGRRTPSPSSELVAGSPAMYLSNAVRSFSSSALSSGFCVEDIISSIIMCTNDS